MGCSVMGCGVMGWGAMRFDATGVGAVRLAVLVSGTGSILKAMLEAALPVVVVVADRPSRGLEIAANAGIDTVLLARRGWTAGGDDGRLETFDREAYCCKLAAVLSERDVDVVAMAGFGTVLDSSFFAWDDGRYRGRVLNTHPSLLPAFPGWHAVRDALNAGVSESGCSVHMAIPEVDAGPLLAQRKVPVHSGDDEATLHERIKEAERELYPATVSAFLGDLVRLDSLALRDQADSADSEESDGCVTHNETQEETHSETGATCER